MRTNIAFFILCAAPLMLSSNARAEKCLGVNDHIIWRNNAEQDAAFARYLESGTRFLRVGADWSAVEGQGKGIYNPRYTDRLDYFMQKASDNGIKVLMIAAYAPEWANGGNKGSGYAPKNEADFADYCAWLLRRYAKFKDSGGQRTLEAIELWNEPDLADLFFKPYKRGSVEAATMYGKMVVAAGGRLKAVRTEIDASNVRILAPVISDPHSVAWSGWMDAFYAVPGVVDNYDVFAWHSYWQSAGGWLPPKLPPCFNAGNQSGSVMGKLTAPKGLMWPKIVAAGDDKKPNWCTEIGGAASSDVIDHKASLLSFAEQAMHMQDAIETLKSGKVNHLDRVYWYCMFDNPTARRDQPFYGLLAFNGTNPIAYAGPITMIDAKFTPKPAYEIYKNAGKIMIDPLLMESAAGK